MSDTRDLVIRILGESKSVEDTLTKTNAGLDNMAKTVGIVGAATLAMGVMIDKALGTATRAASDYGKEVVTVQRLTGMGAEESSKWAAIFDRLGVNGTQVGAVFKALSVAISSHNKDLEAAGIATTDSSGKNRQAMEVLADLADMYQQADDKTAVLELGTKALGKGFQDFLPLLAGGREAIEAYAKTASESGMILSEADLAEIRAYNKALSENEVALKGATIQVGLATMPWETFKAKAISGTYKELRKLNPELAGLVGSVGSVGAPLLQLVGTIGTVGAGLPYIAKMFGSLSGAAADAGAAVSLLRAGASVTSVASLGGAAAATATALAALAAAASVVVGVGLGVWIDSVLQKLPGYQKGWDSVYNTMERVGSLGKKTDQTMTLWEWLTLPPEARASWLEYEDAVKKGTLGHRLATASAQTSTESLTSSQALLSKQMKDLSAAASESASAVEKAAISQAGAALDIKDAEKAVADALSMEGYREASAKLTETVRKAAEQRTAILKDSTKRISENNKDFAEQSAALSASVLSETKQLWDEYASSVQESANRLKSAFGGLFGEVKTDKADALAAAQKNLADATARLREEEVASLVSRVKQVTIGQTLTVAQTGLAGSVRIVAASMGVAATEDAKLTNARAALLAATTAVTDAQNALNGTDIINNLQAQKAALIEYINGLDTLARKGVSQAIIDDVRAQGPGAIEQIRAMLNMTGGQVATLNKTYLDINKLTHDEAKKSAGDVYTATLTKIAALKTDAAKELDGYRDKWRETNASIRTDSAQRLAELASNTRDTVKSLNAIMAKELAEHGKKSDAYARAVLRLRSAKIQLKDADKELATANKENAGAEAERYKVLKKLETVTANIARNSANAAKWIDDFLGSPVNKAAAAYGGPKNRALGAIERATPGGVIRRLAEDGDDEAIIPINDKWSSMALLMETASRMGVSLSRNIQTSVVGRAAAGGLNIASGAVQVVINGGIANGEGAAVGESVLDALRTFTREIANA